MDLKELKAKGDIFVCTKSEVFEIARILNEVDK